MRTLQIVKQTNPFPSTHIDPEQHARLKEYCDITGTTIRKTLNEAIEDFLTIVAPARLAVYSQREKRKK